MSKHQEVLKVLKFTLKNIDFFDSSLYHNFSKLRLYYNVNVFVNQIQQCD